MSHRARGAARPTSNTQPPSPGPARPFGSEAAGEEATRFEAEPGYPSSSDPGRFQLCNHTPPGTQRLWFPGRCPAGHGNNAAGSLVGIVYGRNYDGDRACFEHSNFFKVNASDPAGHSAKSIEGAPRGRGWDRR
ncbi:hypothetical protein CRENBAI_007564 [Crenichthys baileyi]|uniref:Uncharacterized protein n=1 Tax=Crenichthys baileyi TaxID=28760 RepID=A0AAV9SQU3_9TELE